MEVSPIEFDEICAAQIFLAEFVSIEEKFDILLENYFELVLELLAIAARDSIFQTQEASLREIPAKINRRFLNFLSAARMYLDHTSEHLSRLFGSNSIECKFFQQARMREHGDHPEYVVMEKLRNHAQHAGQPVDSTHLVAKWLTVGQDKFLAYSVEGEVTPAGLLKNKKFSRSLIQDMEESPKSTDLKNLSRVYMQCLGEIQLSLRVMLSSKLKISEELTINIVDRYCCESRESKPPGLAAIAFNKDGTADRYVYICNWNIDLIKKFVSKNGSFTNFSRRIVLN